MKKYIAIILISLATWANAQDGNVMIVSYLPAVTMGDASDFVNNFSPRGVDFEVNRYVREDLTVGLMFGWNVFREKLSDETFEFNEALITGTQFRYLNTSPINATAKKFFSGRNEDATPYIGLGIGTSYAKKRTDFGVYTIAEEKWLFHVAPEVGIHYNTIRNVISLKVRYNYSPGPEDFGNISYLSFGIGIGLN